MRRLAFAALLMIPGIALAQQPAPQPARPTAGDSVLPPLPDSTGWGTHVLAVARDPRGAVWVGTYGRGIYRLDPGAAAWASVRSDTTDTSISWDFVQAFGFGPRGEIWYGTVGNGWGLSTDGGSTWRNWTLKELGPEWQYVAPGGIATRGDTTVVGTADGLQVTVDGGAHWLALTDSVGPLAKGPADSAVAVLPNEYVRRLGATRQGWVVALPATGARLAVVDGKWTSERLDRVPFAPSNLIVVGKDLLRGTQCGLRPITDSLPCLARASAGARVLPGVIPTAPRTTWFRRPIDATDNPFIDQTYRYGSTMGGNFQQHQGVEFNNPDGTPVHAIGDGEVVYAGRAEAGALTVAIRHDSVLAVDGKRLRIFSVYYHNSALETQVGQRVTAGQVISRVGNTGRATNDHLHLEVHASPTDSVRAIVDSLNRFPAYTTNPELWIEPLPGTGIVAGRVIGPDGAAVKQARIYGLVKPQPAETPYSFAETYGDRAHPHPLYGEHFAVGDVPPGVYVVGTEIAGHKVFRRIRVEPGKVTWVEFR